MPPPTTQPHRKSHISISSQTDGTSSTAFLAARTPRASSIPLPSPPDHATRSLHRATHAAPYHARPYWWLPLSAGTPHIRPVHTPPSRRRAGRGRSVAFASHAVARSIKRIRAFPAAPAITRRWSSTGLITSESPPPRQSAPRPHRSTSSAAAALVAVRAKLAAEGRGGAPTRVTLRRASARLDTVAQRWVGDVSGDVRTAPTRGDGARAPAGGVYLVTREELDGLAELARRTFKDGTALAKGEARTRAQSAPARILASAAGGAAPLKSGPADVAVTVAVVHTVMRPVARRDGSSEARGARRASVVVAAARKSIHEIVWEEDGTPQSLRSSTWKRGGGAAEGGGDGLGEGGGWCSDSFRRELDVAGKGGEALAMPPLVFTPFWTTDEKIPMVRLSPVATAATSPMSPLEQDAVSYFSPLADRARAAGDLGGSIVASPSAGDGERADETSVMPPLIFTPFWTADEKSPLVQVSPTAVTTAAATSPLAKDAISFFPQLPQHTYATASRAAGDVGVAPSVSGPADGEEGADEASAVSPLVFTPFWTTDEKSPLVQVSGTAVTTAAATSPLARAAMSFFPALPPPDRARADSDGEEYRRTLYGDGVDDARGFGGDAAAAAAGDGGDGGGAVWVQRVRIAGAGVEVGVWTQGSGERGWDC